ncbi:MAG: ATP-binding protein [Candidatus Wallbacteria bacterium]
MVIKDPPLFGHVDRKLALSFGAVVLLLMLTSVGIASLLYADLQVKEEDRLSGALASILGKSISRVSFSGKYHARLLVEEMILQVSELAFISVETPEGLIIAHSNPSKNDTFVSITELQANKKCLEKNSLIISESSAQKTVKEVLVPYHGGLDAEILGVVRVGVNVEEARKVQSANMIKLLFLITFLTILAIIIVFILSRYFGSGVKMLANQLQGILDNSPALIYMKDKNGRYIFVNRQWTDLFHTTNEKIKGKNDIEIFKNDIGKQFMDNDRRVFESNSAIELEEQALVENTIHYYHSIKVALRDAATGEPYALCGFSNDITDKKNTEAELHKHREHLEELVNNRTNELAIAKDRAETANRAKSLFLSNMSHELRTPMNAILGFAHIMAHDSAITQIQKENLEIILKSGEHLLKIINDILDIAKIEAGKIEAEFSDFDLEQLTNDLLTMLRVRAEFKGLKLIMDQSSSFPKYVRTDQAKLRQIIINLVGNAIKYTNKGQITMKLYLMSAPDNKQYLSFEIEDTGIGIKPQDIEKIFIPFVQIGQHEGTGLGLPITQQYIKLLGGTINVTSKPGAGSKFAFSIEYIPANPSDIQKNQVTQGRVISIENADNYRILIAEDQPENRLLLKNLLTPFGFQLKEAINGEECIEMFKTWQPHVIFMDRRMPLCDGCSAANQIRARQESKDTAIIAVTAQAFKEDRQEMLDAGCDTFIAKPFMEDEIFNVLEKYLKITIVRDNMNEKTKDELNITSEQTIEMLKKLPEGLKNELTEALIRLNMKEIERIISVINEQNTALGSILSAYTNKFNYTPILNILKKISEEKL